MPILSDILAAAAIWPGHGARIFYGVALTNLCNDLVDMDLCATMKLHEHKEFMVEQTKL